MSFRIYLVVLTLSRSLYHTFWRNRLSTEKNMAGCIAKRLIGGIGRPSKLLPTSTQSSYLIISTPASSAPSSGSCRNCTQDAPSLCVGNTYMYILHRLTNLFLQHFPISRSKLVPWPNSGRLRSRPSVSQKGCPKSSLSRDWIRKPTTFEPKDEDPYVGGKNCGNLALQRGFDGWWSIFDR